MKYKSLILLLSCFVVCTISLSINAEEPAQLSAEQLTYTSYDFWGSGEVIFKHKTLVITCDSFHLAKGKDIITFSGNVTLNDGDNWTRGNVAIYNLANQEITISEAVTELTTDFLSEPAFIRGNEIRIADSSVIVTTATATTCELEKPHYHIQADTIEIYHDQYMVLRNIRFYDGNLTLFMFPYFLLPLTEDTAFEFPKIGSSFYEGFFIKTTLAYYLSQSSHGAFLIDYMEKKGLGLGIRHLYKSGADSGSIYLYHILSPKGVDPRDFEMQYSHEHVINENMKLSGWVKYQRYLSANLSAKWSLPKSSWQIDMTYTNMLNKLLLQRLKGAVIVDQQIGDSFHISSSNTLTVDEMSHRSTLRYNKDTVNMTLTSSLRAIIDSAKDPQYSVSSGSTYFFGNFGKARTILSISYRDYDSQSTSGIPTGYGTLTYPLTESTSMQVRSSRYATYDRDQINLSGYVKDTSWSLVATSTEPKGKLVVLDEYPEITVNTPKLRIGSYTFPIDLSLRLGRMIEKPSLKEALRSDASLNYNSNAIDLTDNISLRISGYTKYTSYDDVAQRLAINLQTTTNMQLTKWLSGTSTYTNRKVYGQSPFQSDRMSNEHSLANYIRLATNRISMSMNAKYDVDKQTLGTIWSTAQYTLSPGRYASITTNYDPQISAFTDITTSLQIGLWDTITIGGYISHDLIKDRTNYMSVNTNATIGETTTLTYNYRLSGYSSLSATTETQSLKLQSTHFNVQNELSRNLTTNTISRLDVNVEAKLPLGLTVEYRKLQTPYTSKSTTSITKDLHCREVKFFYENNNHAFWFEYRIKGLDLNSFRTH